MSTDESNPVLGLKVRALPLSSTATQKLADGHETEDRKFPPSMLWNAHELPLLLPGGVELTATVRGTVWPSQLSWLAPFSTN